MAQILPVQWSFEAIGTKWQILLYTRKNTDQIDWLKGQVSARIQDFDAIYSRFRDDSLITRMSMQSGSYEFPSEDSRLFAFYRKLYDATEGLVTPLIGQALADAGYDAQYSLRPKTLSTVPNWPDVLSLENTTVTTTEPVLLDFGAAGKGYLVDCIGKLLLEAGYKEWCINAGGDICCYGLRSPLRIGLEHPTDPEQMIGVIELSDGAICASAGNKRAWANYTHILNPKRLQSQTNIAATWCSAADTLTADGLATALFFVEPESLEALAVFEYCIVYADGTLRCSKQFKSAVFQPEETNA